jgi:hypothetical protein
LTRENDRVGRHFVVVGLGPEGRAAGFFGVAAFGVAFWVAVFAMKVVKLEAPIGPGKHDSMW